MMRSSMGTGWNVHWDGMFQILLSLLWMFAHTCVSSEGGGAVILADDASKEGCQSELL